MLPKSHKVLPDSMYSHRKGSYPRAPPNSDCLKPSSRCTPLYLSHIQGAHDRSEAEHVAHGPPKFRRQLDGLVQKRCPLLGGARAAQDVHGQHDGHGVEPVRAARSEGRGPVTACGWAPRGGGGRAQSDRLERVNEIGGRGQSEGKQAQGLLIGQYKSGVGPEAFERQAEGLVIDQRNSPG